MAIQQEPVIPVAPAWCTSGISAYFYYLWLAILHFVGLGSDDVNKWSVRRPGRRVLGQSCRGLFAILWNNYAKPDSKILISPFHHHSFMRMMRKEGQELVVMDTDDDKLLEPTDYTAKDFDVVVISHMLGRDYKSDWLREWKRQNPKLLIIEDRVQAGLLTRGNENLCDVSLYSAGQDKIPNAMGGGYALVHKDDDLFEFMVREVEKLPFETNWERLYFLLKKLPTVGCYNVRFLCHLVERGARFFGMSLNQLIDSYRKGNPGFMHGGYMIRPSPALIQAMDRMQSTSEWEVMQDECISKYQLFLDHIPPQYVNNVKVCNSDVSCCYFFIRLPNFDTARDHMALRGIMTIGNQTFLPAVDSVADQLKHMCTLPSFLALSDDEIKYIAKAVTECWEMYG